jgi:hypothetical protein
MAEPGGGLVAQDQGLGVAILLRSCGFCDRGLRDESLILAFAPSAASGRLAPLPGQQPTALKVIRRSKAARDPKGS